MLLQSRIHFIFYNTVFSNRWKIDIDVTAMTLMLLRRSRISLCKIKMTKKKKKNKKVTTKIKAKKKKNQIRKKKSSYKRYAYQFKILYRAPQIDSKELTLLKLSGRPNIVDSDRIFSNETFKKILIMLENSEEEVKQNLFQKLQYQRDKVRGIRFNEKYYAKAYNGQKTWDTRTYSGFDTIKQNVPLLFIQNRQKTSNDFNFFFFAQFTSLRKTYKNKYQVQQDKKLHGLETDDY